ncbi:ankyrin repeat-containing domain protein [Colletotrichum navitas]|uniref:Ankyrin repeat-containing domain protein n=1 Tax=Colletotrichum navitas TaxID=681940 RepID=A0AAD8PNP1_9PEZI|nr:ankyrin repeat-containing domain protein [Colletotrichum navitas]KAK1573550.1 ankyrin repeat-containing domain protein [Colletotrichum navitas]
MIGIHLASAFGLYQIVECLLASGTCYLESQTEGDWTALHWAARRGHEKVVSTILQSTRSNGGISKALTGMTTKLDEWTPLHLAAKEGHLPVVEILSEDRSVNINAVDAQGRTPLFLACRDTHVLVVRFLLRKGANPNLQDVYGMTALHCATKTGDLELSGWTPLHLAAQDSNEGAFKVLLRHGANPELEDIHGLTPHDYRIRSTGKPGV